MTTCDEARGENHAWRLGPFYITAAGTSEEPTFYPPGALVQVEHCTRCGLLRLPDMMRLQTCGHLTGGY